MSERSSDTERREPEGFTPHNSGPASERAREQGWQTNEEERIRTPREHQPIDGGTDYDYGARDFGDVPEDTSSAQPSADSQVQTDPNSKEKRNKSAA